jgi:putative transposase
MKKRRGRYGVPMQVYGSILPGAASVARLLPRATTAGKRELLLSPKAKHRLSIIRWHEAHGGNVSLTARHFGFSRTTLYTWLKRYEALGPRGLEERSRRPHHFRQRTWTEIEVDLVRRVRRKHPGWGKDKIAAFLRPRGFRLPVSRIGRILAYLKKERLIREATLADPWIAKRFHHRPYAVRKPRSYKAMEPGDLVEIDSAHVRLVPGQVFKHFTARDVVSRWDVLDVFYRATADSAAAFLKSVLERMPFSVKAIQVDGGSEFKAGFEAACEQLGLKLFVLPPRSPKLNGHVERAQRTHKEEFYQMLDPPDSLAELRAQLLKQEQRYNTYRPHQALGHKTPDEWLLACAERR